MVVQRWKRVSQDSQSVLRIVKLHRDPPRVRPIRISNWKTSQVRCRKRDPFPPTPQAKEYRKPAGITCHSQARILASNHHPINGLARRSKDTLPTDMTRTTFAPNFS